VAPRVSPSERVRVAIDALFSSDQDLASVLEDVGRLTVRLLMQQAIEAEVDAFLGRRRYECRSEDAPAGARNGWQPPTAVKTTMGPLELQRPKLRGSDEKFCSQLFGVGVTRTNALEALVVSAWVRGLSDRDVEAALREVLGDEAALSKSTVSRICQQIKDEFAEFALRELSGLRLDYLFIDGSNFKFHEHSPAEPVLCAWGIDTDGKPHLVGLAGRLGVGRRLAGLPRGPRRARARVAPPRRLRRRTGTHRGDRAGLPPLASPAVCDPSPAQRGREGLQSRPGRLQVRLVGDLRQDRGATRRQGRRRGAPAHGRLQAQWERAYPSAVACLTEDFESLTVHLRFPQEHWRRCRHTNLIERTFGETRRRTKVIGRLPGERTCVALVFAVLDRQSRGWRGMTMTPRALRRLQDLRRELFDQPAEPDVDNGVTAAA